MRIEDAINKERLKQVSYKYKEDFAEVVQTYPDSTVKIRLTTRPGFFDKVIVLGNYIPQPNEKGTLHFVGNSDTPVFMPLKPAESFLDSQIPGTVKFESKGDLFSSKGFINLQDVLEQNPEYKQYIFANASKSQEWGVAEFIEVILRIGRSFYATFNRKLEIHDIAILQGGKFGPHKGVGHATGKGCDMYDINGILNNVYKITTDYAYEQAKTVLNIFKSCGAFAVIWDTDLSRYRNSFKKDFGNFIRQSGGSHTTHWHVSIIEPGQSQ